MARVVRLGARCDLVTEEDARRRLLDEASAGDEQHPRDDAAGAGPARCVPEPGVPVLDPRGAHFRVEEFAVLADDRRIVLSDDRGFTLGGGADPWEQLTLAGLADDVRATVLPDDAEETGEEHPWEAFATLLAARGLDASADDLRRLPYVVEFSDRVRARVAAGG